MLGDFVEGINKPPGWFHARSFLPQVDHPFVVIIILIILGDLPSFVASLTDLIPVCPAHRAC